MNKKQRLTRLLCFCCGRNVNNIDVLMSLEHDFLAAVELLQQWLRSHLRRRTKC